MADEPRTDQPSLELTTPPGQSPPPTTQPSGHIDPEEFYALRDQNARYEAAFRQFEPYADDIAAIVQDETKRNVARDAWKAFESVRQSHEPQVPPELKPLYDKVNHLSDFANKFEQQQRDAAEAPQREFAQRWQSWQNDRGNNRFYERLRQEQPDLQPRDLQYLAQVAAEKNFAPLEDVWKEESWRFVKAPKTTPPTSLRSDAGDIGIPAPSANDKQTTIRQRIVQLERERTGA